MPGRQAVVGKVIIDASMHAAAAKAAGAELTPFSGGDLLFTRVVVGDQVAVKTDQHYCRQGAAYAAAGHWRKQSGC